MFKVNNRNSRTKYEIFSKLTIKTPEQRHWRRSGVFIFNFERISKHVSIIIFEQVNTGWLGSGPVKQGKNFKGLNYVKKTMESLN